MPNTTTLGENIRTLDGTEWVRLATPGANWRTQISAIETFFQAPLTSTSDTNVTITLGGAPSTCLLTAASITMGWTGTLAAGRLNANVVQSVVNDTNVTGSIASQALTLGWTGTLAVGRGGTGAATFTTNGVLYGNAASALQVTAQGPANSVLTANAGAPSFSAAPTIGTSVTTPLLIGGTAAGSTLTLESTSGAGTTDYVRCLTNAQLETWRATTTQSLVLNPFATGNIGVQSVRGKLEVWSTAGIWDTVVMSYASGGSPGGIVLGNTRNATAGSFTATVINDTLSHIQFVGDTGAQYFPAAGILASAAGTWTSTSTPSQMQFQTCASGSMTSVSAMLLTGAQECYAIGVGSGLGYGNGFGVGSTVTQATSKATGVTLSFLAGQITMNGAALAANTNVSFVLTNTTIRATDSIHVNHVSAGTIGAYQVNASGITSGSCTITVRNATAGSLSEAIVVGFMILRSTIN
jgi:hypothetical protein